MPILMNMPIPAAAALVGGGDAAARTRQLSADVDATAAARDPFSARNERINETADEAAVFSRVYGRAGGFCIVLRVVLADAGMPARSTGPEKMSTTLTRLRPRR